MIRKEARIRLLTMREELMHKYMFDEAEALTIAVEALQTPPISQRSMYQTGYRQGREEALKDRPKGKWHKNVEYSATGNERAMADQCSVCSGMVPWGMSDKFDFCPNCGADMRGEDE